ncbi:uncharacterized protein VTP21DRAFT_7890 [Calcarisporiella thermophila]|uniref:uncharacterized protein n=1 Tax=Calcarisporiella thermophila TaxID=911321 RepID=UPI0037442A51
MAGNIDDNALSLSLRESLNNPKLTENYESKKEDTSTDTTIDPNATPFELTPKEQEIIKKQTYVAERRLNAHELFRYATKLDIFLMIVGLIASGVVGAATPLMTIMFSGLVDTFTNFMKGVITPSKVAEDINANVLYILYIAIATFVCGYLYMATWIYTGERQTRIMREKYLAAILRQNIGYFDKIGAGEVTSRITNDTHQIQDGISEKIPIAFKDVCAFIAAFVIAFTANWKLTLVCLCILPLILFSVWLFVRFVARIEAGQLDIFGQASTIADEAFSAIRTVQAFSAQRKLESLYNKKMEDAKKKGYIKWTIISVAIALIFMWIYLAYSLAFYYGTTMLLSGELSSGTIVRVFFPILIGSFSIANVAPSLQAFSLGLASGAKIYEAIDREPPIDSSSTEGSKPENVKGFIQPFLYYFPRECIMYVSASIYLTNIPTLHFYNFFGGNTPELASLAGISS